MARDRTPSDESLLALYLSGDRKGADALFSRHRPALLVYLMRRLGDRDLAEESLQETFCRFLERARALSSHPRLQSWLFSVARNVSVDVCRRRRVRAAPFTDLAAGGFEWGLEDSGESAPETLLASRELNAALLRALRELPGPEREVFLLRAHAALPFREIAARLGAPLNTVLSRMHRALKRVRKAMMREGWEEEDDPGRRRG